MSALLRLLRGVAGVGVLAWLINSRHRLPAAAAGREVNGAASAPARPEREEPVRRPEVTAASASVHTLQVLLAAMGVGLLAWGAWLILGLGADQWLSAGLWLAGGVIGHDALLAPIVVILGVLAVRLAPSAARAPLTVALIVWGSITRLAVPVLGQFGALADNPTLLNRPYLKSWLISTGIGAAAVLVATFVRLQQAGSKSGARSTQGAPS